MVTKKKETITFLGKEYELKKIFQADFLPSLRKPPIVIRYGYGCDGKYVACTSGSLYELSVDGGERRTPQGAATALEKVCFKEFRKIGAALGYDVEK